MSEREQLVAELKQLRRGRGLTATAMDGCPAVLEALGASNGADALPLLKQRISDVGNDDKVAALKAAYAIDTAGANLTQRRSDFAVAGDRHHDTIEAWENSVIDELAARLLHAPQSPELKMTPMLAPDNFIIASASATFMINQGVYMGALETYEYYEKHSGDDYSLIKTKHVEDIDESADSYRYCDRVVLHYPASMPLGSIEIEVLFKFGPWPLRNAVLERCASIDDLNFGLGQQIELTEYKHKRKKALTTLRWFDEKPAPGCFYVAKWQYVTFTKKGKMVPLSQ